MIRRRGLPPAIWWMFGLLVVAALSVTLGGHPTDTNPSTSNYDASGEAALYALLQRAGYTVVEDQRTNPNLEPHDVAICLHTTASASVEQAFGGVDPDEEFYNNLSKFLSSGGRAVVFRYSPDFQDVSKRVQDGGPTTVKNDLLNKTLSVMTERPNGLVGTELEDQARSWLPVWSVNKTTLVEVGRVGKGAVAVCDSSIPASNRFLDKEDDAEFVASVIGLEAKPGVGRLVFTEGSFGNISDLGFFELLGTWALSAWRQAIVLFIVLIFALGKRFGYPEERRRVVQSSRDLADSFGDLLFRARRVDLCTQMALTRLDNRIRKIFRVPRDASIEERNRVLPEPIFNAIRRLEIAAGDEDTRGSEALKLVQAANREIDEYAYAAAAR